MTSLRSQTGSPFYSISPAKFHSLACMMFAAAMFFALPAKGNGPSPGAEFNAYDTHASGSYERASVFETYLHTAPFQVKSAVLQLKCPEDMMLRCINQLTELPTTLDEFIFAGGFAESNCGFDVASFMVTEESTGNCPEIINRTYSITDLCGETFSCVQQVMIVDDETAPELFCPNDLTVECPSDVPPPDPFSVVATDVCGTATVDHLRDDSVNVASCPGFVFRTYIAADQCGNVATCVQTITIADNCDPNNPCQPLCDPTSPVLTADLSNLPDGTWTSPATSAGGTCCANSGSPADNCVQISLTLSEATVGIIFDLESGPFSPGSMVYTLDCGSQFNVGELVCLAGGQQYELIFCNSGLGTNTFSITTFSSDALPDNNGNGVPDECEEPCDPFFVGVDGCAVLYVGYRPGECTDLTVDVVGGAAPYNFQWSSGQSGQQITVCFPNEGFYTVTVTDSKGCIEVLEVFVPAVKVSCGTGGQVFVCHYNPELRVYTSECVDSSQVEVHLAHGDVLGPCGASPCRPTDNPILYGDDRITLKPGGNPRPLAIDEGGSPDRLFPNPAKDRITVNFDMANDGVAEISIIDVQGQLIQSKQESAPAGYNESVLDLANVGPGLYFVRISKNDEMTLLKFVKAE